MVCFLAVIKARILSAHDKGTHAEVVVKVKKVLKSGKVKIARNNRSIYPESWTNRGCTCPILNPGKDKMLTVFVFFFPVNSGDNSLWTLAMAAQHFPSVFLGQSPLTHPDQRSSQETAAVNSILLPENKVLPRIPNLPGSFLLSVTLFNLPEYQWLEECSGDKNIPVFLGPKSFLPRSVFSHHTLLLFGKTRNYCENFRK